MFFAVIFILIGIFLLLNAFGIIVGNFWGFFWAILFIVLGLRLLVKKGGCPICSGHWWKEKMHRHCCDEDHQ